MRHHLTPKNTLMDYFFLEKLKTKKIFRIFSGFFQKKCMSVKTTQVNVQFQKNNMKKWSLTDLLTLRLPWRHRTNKKVKKSNTSFNLLILFSKFVVSLNVLFSSLNRTRNWQYGWTFNFFLQSLHRGDTSWWSMPLFIKFVLSACSWAAHIRLSVSCFSSAASRHCHLLWYHIPSLSLRNWPCNAFSFLTVCLSFFHSSHQSLFLVVTLQLQLLEILRYCLQYNQRG